MRANLLWPKALVQAAGLSLAALVFFIVVEGAFFFRGAIGEQFFGDAVNVRHFFPVGENRRGVALLTEQPANTSEWHVVFGVWDLASGSAVNASFVRLPGLTAVCASPMGDVFVSTRGEIYTLDALAAAPSLRLIGRGTPVFPHIMECTDDGELLLMAGIGLGGWKRDGTKLWRSDVVATCGKFMSATRRFFCACFDGRLLELDATTGEIRRCILEGLPQVTRLAVSADGRLLAIRDSMGLCMLYDLEANRVRGTIRITSTVADMQFTSEGNKLIVASTGPGVEWAVFSTDSLRLVRAVKGQSSLLTRLRLGSKGNLFVWNRGRTVSAWNVETGKLMDELTVDAEPAPSWRSLRDWFWTSSVAALWIS